jgi:hypothetical protein
VYGTLTFTNAPVGIIAVDPGQPGSGGTKVGSSFNGANGATGAAGTILKFNITNRVFE